MCELHTDVCLAAGRVELAKPHLLDRWYLRHPLGHGGISRLRTAALRPLGSRGAARTRYGSNRVLCRPGSDGTCAPPSRPKTPGSIHTGGKNERCERNGAKLRPCGRHREVRAEPGVRIAAPAGLPVDGAEVVPPSDRC